MITILVVLVIVILIYVHQPRFGNLPSGDRKARIEKSPNYRDGQFRNQTPTPLLSGDKGYFSILIDFLFRKPKRVVPQNEIPVEKHNLHKVAPHEEMLVWFGHSSYMLQTGGMRILVDPVFNSYASPIWFINKAFNGTNQFRIEDVPHLDYLIITHDHWDHLDYLTVTQLRHHVDTVICPLGVGEHLEAWGFDVSDIIEMDWNEDTLIGENSRIYCLPARHFSGRRFERNQSLWASFLIHTPKTKIFLGGDSGYGPHFAEIGDRFNGVDFAILENGQYDKRWKNIHTLPSDFAQVAKDLGAKSVVAVHNSKFALSVHAWDDPMSSLVKSHNINDFRLLTPKIGEKVEFENSNQQFSRWWEGLR